MKKRILSGITALLICAITFVAPLSTPVYAASFNNVFSSLWDNYLNSNSSNFDDYISQSGADFRQGDFGAERGGTFGTPKRFYTGSSSGQNSTVPTKISVRYESGETVYTPIVSSSGSSYVYNDYITNNSYNITNIEYSPVYNVYKLTTNVTNYYVTNNYTYVTVIHQDDATGETIKQDLYYELPDGRNSFNLSAEDVFGEYFIYNISNYDEILEDDGVTTALFHLDGNLLDSSGSNVGSYLLPAQTSFDSGVFGQALIQRCSSAVNRTLGTRNITFNTLEYWAYYSDIVYSSDGSVEYYSDVYPTNLVRIENDVKTYYRVPSNTWCHIAFVRDNVDTDSFHYYLNGFYQGIVNTYWQLTNNVYDNISGGSLAYSSVFGIDELRFSRNYLYSDMFVPQTQPFDTNSVLVLPDVSTVNANDIFVKSNVPVSNFRVGGVRPTYPIDGFVYLYLENDVVKDVQQYQDNGWYSVDAVIYNDEQWVNLDNYNLSNYVLDEDDMTDGVSPAPDDDSVTVTNDTIVLPFSLYGIPIDEGGNYTDSNGQQWIADTAEIENGKVVVTRNVYKYVITEQSAFYIYPETDVTNSIVFGVFSSTENIIKSDISNSDFLCDKLSYVAPDTITNNKAITGIYLGSAASQDRIRIRLSNILSEQTDDALKAWLADSPITVYYPLAESTTETYTIDQFVNQAGTVNIIQPDGAGLIVVCGSETLTGDNNLTFDDVKENSLSSIVVYGKSFQDGTPSVDNPSYISSIGDDGTTEIKIIVSKVNDEPTTNPDDENDSDNNSVLGELVTTVTDFISYLFDNVFGGMLKLVKLFIDNLTSLLSSFVDITGLIGSLFGFFPDEIVTVLTLGLSTVFLLAIYRMFKG